MSQIDISLKRCHRDNARENIFQYKRNTEKQHQTNHSSTFVAVFLDKIKLFVNRSE